MGTAARGEAMLGRRLRFGLATILGLARRGFFIPYRYADTLAPPGERPSYAAIEALMRGLEDDFGAVVAGLEEYADDLRAIGGDAPPAPRWDQDWFPRLDAAVAYAMVRRLRPRRIVEIGSGHSTRFLARAVADGGLATAITAIDPAPRASLAGLAVELLRIPLDRVGEMLLAGLAAGDVLFVDSSHILVPGSDVDRVLNHVLPALPAGVHIHFHDIFLPDDYPAEWAWRGYNEQLGVAALLSGRGCRLRFASHYATTRMSDALAGSVVAGLPLIAGARESSLWLEKC
ncbi:MAG: class I SAM-dependent methyltransferase [Alphaproteobacteria bacterium]